MPVLTVDGKSVEVAAGTSLMDAARVAGVEVPGLCHARGVRPQTSCMLCVVKDTQRGVLVPSCTARTEDGMVIDTRCEEVGAARKSVLDMLLSEHVGDCEAPCRHSCPAYLDISAMMRRIELGDHEGAARIARDQLILPETLGYVCTAPCEKSCHRAVKDAPLPIRDLHRIVAEEWRESSSPVAVSTGNRVAIVGASAAGLAAAYVLLSRGHACSVFEKSDCGGRMIREYCEEEVDFVVLDSEIGFIEAMGARFQFGVMVGVDITVGQLESEFDALILACDELSGTSASTFAAIEYPMTVNAIAEGKSAADQADRYLRGLPSSRRERPFNSRLGFLRKEELEGFLSRIDPTHSTKKTFAGILIETLLVGPTETRRAEDDSDPHAEASRCLHCECMKPETCKLRQYASEYGGDQSAFRFAARANVEPAQHYGGVVFEPGKCIKCGLCIAVGHDANLAYGMTIEGRGYEAHVKVPFEKELAVAIELNAERCVEICPTGALAFNIGEPHVL